MTILWKTARLGEVCQLIKRGISPKYTEADGISVINQKCIRDHRVNLNLARKHDISKKKVNPERLVKFADVLVNSTGTGTLGRVAQFLSTEEEPITVDTHVTIVRPIEGVFHPAFFGYVMTFIEEQIIAGGEGASGQTELPRAKLENDFLITYPDSIVEQKRIVAILDEAFDGIDTATASTEKNLANARELFESCLNSVFRQKRASWTRTTLGKEIDLMTGFAFKSKGYTDEESGIPLLRGDNILPGKIRWENHKKWSRKDAEVYFKYKLEANDIVLAMDRTWIKSGVKYAHVTANDLPCLLVQRVARLRAGLRMNHVFLKFLIGSASFKNYVLSIQTGLGVPHISGKQISDFEFYLPASTEQADISEALEEIANNIARLESSYQQKLILLNELKQSLLQKAFYGKLTANNVVEITTQKHSKTPIETNSPEFAAHIMAAAYHWHASQSREKTFGRVKAQKTLHLVESLADIDLGRRPIKDAAGPNDFQHMQRAEEWARDQGFFEFIKRSTGQRGYDFRKGLRYGDLVAEAMQALATYEHLLKRVVKVLMPLDTAETEILATVYAAWNNLLLEGIEPTEHAIIHEARENWHADKLKYSEEQFRNAISQLRQNGLVPQGRGKRVTGQESLAL